MWRFFSTLSRFDTLAALALLTTGCGECDKNATEYAAGDRFELTVTGFGVLHQDCGPKVMQVGDVIVLKAGEEVFPDREGCGAIRMGADGVPSYFGGVVDNCVAGSGSLGLHCSGVAGACPFQMNLQVLADFKSNAVYSGQIDVWLSNLAGSGPACASDCTRNVYRVQIRNLGPE